MKISLNFELRTHLDEARKESGFLDAVCNVEKLQNREQLAETHHKAHGVEGVGQSICSQKQQAVCWMLSLVLLTWKYSSESTSEAFRAMSVFTGNFIQQQQRSIYREIQHRGPCLCPTSRNKRMKAEK